MTDIRRERILYVLRVLFERSSVETPVTIADLCDALAEYGVHAERKAIYRDFEMLKEFGFDVKMKRGGGMVGYYTEPYPFTREEISQVRDAVSLSEFLTRRQSNDILHKLDAVCPKQDKNDIVRTVPLRTKATHHIPEKYALLQESLRQGRRVHFVYKKDSGLKEYCLTVYGIVRTENGICVLAGSSEVGRALDIYEIDRMTSLTVADEGIEDIRAVTGDFNLDIMQYLDGRL